MEYAYTGLPLARYLDASSTIYVPSALCWPRLVPFCNCKYVYVPRSTSFNQATWL